MTSEAAAVSTARLGVHRILRPRSIAIVGLSPGRPSVAGGVLANLERFGFRGDIHLVSRNRTEVDGRPCVPEIDALPAGIDVVVLGVPCEATVQAVQACARRKAGSVVVFASGFSEAGDVGRQAQHEIAAIARSAGMAVLGPNCVGLTNFVDGVPLTFASATPAPTNATRTLAIVAQSGGMMANLRSACIAKGAPVSYAISTGNEAVLGAEDFLEAMIDDPRTGVVGLFMEQIREPRRFLELASRARQAGKPLVLLHTGRSEASREAALSHTGALTADYAVMRTLVEREAVIVVDTMEELVDVCLVLTRFAAAPVAGAAVLTDSGAFKGFALDFCEAIRLPLPALSDKANQTLVSVLPEFAAPSNPLDITAQGLLNTQLYGDAAHALLDDTATGSLVVSILPGPAQVGVAIGRSILAAADGSAKPVAYAVMGGESPLSDDLLSAVRAKGIPFFRSPERALRAMSHVTAYGRRIVAHRNARSARPVDVAPPQKTGAAAEYVGKAWLAAAGIPIPAGSLARNVEEALKIAGTIGYPVVLKAQSPKLIHKSDAGGVLVGIGDDAALRAGWQRLHANISRAQPGLVMDGVLVERMAPAGIEMIVGARRVPGWGPVLMVGMGGIWTEALHDVRILPPDLDEDQIIADLMQLQAASLLQGARGTTPCDVPALAQVVARLGALMLACAEVVEVDINPLVVFDQGKGTCALDALIVCKDA